MAYAGEGCAQVLLFESDKDDVCKVNYRTAAASIRGRLVTLPKA